MEADADAGGHVTGPRAFRGKADGPPRPNVASPVDPFLAPPTVPEDPNPLLVAFSCIESAGWVGSDFVLRVFYGDDADVAEFKGGPDGPLGALRRAAAFLSGRPV